MSRVQCGRQVALRSSPARRSRGGKRALTAQLGRCEARALNVPKPGSQPLRGLDMMVQQSNTYSLLLKGRFTDSMTCE